MTEHATDATFSLPGELTIYTVTETHQQWLEHWPSLPLEDSLQVGAAAVEQIDAAGLQLLVSLRRSLAQREQRLELLQPSAALTRACLAFGCHTLLDTHAPASAPIATEPANAEAGA
ncbi:hypothetical protein BH11PSE9_BH11PSE9_21610 [soil metagenome]